MVFALGSGGTACRHGEPPSPAVDGAVAELAAKKNVVTTTDAAAKESVTASVDAEAGDAGVDPGTLPQTRDKPQASGPAFDERMRGLWDAVVQDDPDKAIASFFPVSAYEQVKAIPTPARDWKFRLMAAYKRDIHALHEELGARASRAKLLRVEVPEARARWVEPNEETNAIGYYRVYGTRIVYDVDGRERSFDVKSLISWRGEWYVVHLSGFK